MKTRRAEGWAPGGNPGRLGQRVGHIERGQAGYQLIGPGRHLLVGGQDPLQDLSFEHAKAVGTGGHGDHVEAGHRGRALDHELRPAGFHFSDVFDQAAQAQLTHRRLLEGRLVAQAPNHVAQESPLGP
jgi:hypothetical protein